MKEKTIIINRAIIHSLIMNKGVDYSDKLIDLSNSSTDYYYTKIEKCLGSDQIKEVIVHDNHLLLLSSKDMLGIDESFIKESKLISREIYGVCKHVDNMPNSDLLFIDCKIDGVVHILILKLNYKLQATHIKDDGNCNRIIESQVVPGSGAPVDEAIIINTDNNTLYLIEKKFKIDGKPGYYLNEQYIKGEPMLTDKQKMKILVKVVKKVDNDYGAHDGNILAMLYKTILKLTENDVPLNIHNTVDLLFENNYECVEESHMILNDLGIAEEEVITNIKSSDKMCRCKLKLDDDRVLELDLEDYLEGANFETSFDENGMKKIIIKNINNILVA